jgi:hypothetical protein
VIPARSTAPRATISARVPTSRSAARRALAAGEVLGQPEEARTQARFLEDDRSPGRFTRRWAGLSLSLPPEAPPAGRKPQ